MKNIWRKDFIYNIKYYGTPSLNKPTSLYSFFLNKFKQPKNKLIFCESKMQELFEYKDKSKYLSYYMLNVDITELNTLDNYKENYPFTGAYANSLRILKNKDSYLENQTGYKLNEFNEAFSALENFIKVYETMYILNSYSEEVKLFLGRLDLKSHMKYDPKYFFTANRYDTEERYQQDLEILLNNYKILYNKLEENPEWQVKFKNDFTRLFATSNVKKSFPQVYEIYGQQEIFK